MLKKFISTLYLRLLIFVCAVAYPTNGSETQSYAMEKMKDTLYVTIIGSPNLQGDLFQVIKTLCKVRRIESAHTPNINSLKNTKKSTEQNNSPPSIRSSYSDFSRYSTNRSALKTLYVVGGWDFPIGKAIITLKSKRKTKQQLPIRSLIAFLNKMGIHDISIDLDGEIINYYYD